MSNENGQRTHLSALEPWLFRLAVLGLLVGAAFVGYRLLAPPSTSVTHVNGQAVVVLDVVKMANAQRQVAAAFLGKDPAGQDGALLLNVQESTKDVIRQVAGPGTLVLIKQAVIHTDVPDITDEVLRRLKLPVDVPTQDPAQAALDFAPTILGLMPPPPAIKPVNAPGSSAASSKGLLP